MAEVKVREITVVGAGFMGTVIATMYARHGYRVKVTDLAPQALDTFHERARPIAASLINDHFSSDTILSNVVVEPAFDVALKQSFLVHEVIHENLGAKQRLFEQLDSLCPPEVVLATNTSSFRISEICENVRGRERIIGIHYVTPAHIIDVVEIIIAGFTPQPLVKWAHEFLATINHVGVVCSEEPGFLVNRLQYALLSEAYRIVEQGIASRDDVDRAMKLSLGPRLALWGPLLTEDLVVSKKTSAPIWDYLYDKTGEEKFKRPPAITKFVEDGDLGAITGKGWYRFGAEYASVVMSRDAQLKELLDWLRAKETSDVYKLS